MPGPAPPARARGGAPPRSVFDRSRVRGDGHDDAYRRDRRRGQGRAADTAQQAQAQIQQILRKVGSTQGIEVRGAEFGQVKPLGTDYGEAPVSVSFDCGIEQFVNFLATLTGQPEMLGTSDIRVSSANPKDKHITVRLTVSGVVPKKLVPEKKAMTTF